MFRRGHSRVRTGVAAGIGAVAMAVAIGSCAPPESGDQSKPVAQAQAQGQIADTAAGNFLAGRFAQDTHDLGTAAAFLRGAVRDDPEELEVLRRAHLALAADGQLGEAAEISRRVLKYDTDAAIAAVIVAEQDAKAGRWSAAKDRLDALPKRGFNVVLVPLLSAWAEMGQGHVDRALADLDALNADGHQTALYEYNAALICDLADRRSEAEKHYRAALSTEGGDALRTVQAAAAFFRRTGAADSAADIVRRYEAEKGDSPMVDLDGSARPIDSPRAGMAEALFALAGTLRQTSAADLALIFARLALDLEPDFALAQMLAGDTLQDMGRLEAANDVYRSIDTNSPAHWTAQLRIAGDYNGLNRVDDAIHTLEAASARHPDRPEALIVLGDILRRHSRWTEATAAYDRALTVIGKPRRQDWALFYSRGICEHEANQWPKAESDFLQALTLEPDQPDVLNYLGYSWVEKGINIDRAKTMIEKALARRPTDGFIVDSLGWVYFRTGLYDKAVAEMERAIELAPEDATVNSHLGDVLAAVGRWDEARFQWQRALVFNPEPDLKAELQRKLKEGFVPPPPIRPTKDSAAQ